MTAPGSHQGMTGGIPIHVASPLQYTMPGRIFYSTTLVPILTSNGFRPLAAWDNAPTVGRSSAARRYVTLRPTGAAEAAAIAFAEANQAMLDRCRGVFAVLDGTDVDSGVAAEVGYAAARGLPIVGWRSDIRRAGEPVATHVSLQVEHFIAITGGQIVSDLDIAVRLMRTLTTPKRR